MTFRQWYYNLPQAETSIYREKIIRGISPSNRKRGEYKFKELLNERIYAGELEQGVINKIAGRILTFIKINPSERQKRSRKKPFDNTLL